MSVSKFLFLDMFVKAAALLILASFSMVSMMSCRIKVSSVSGGLPFLLELDDVDDIDILSSLLRRASSRFPSPKSSCRRLKMALCASHSIEGVESKARIPSFSLHSFLSRFEWKRSSRKNLEEQLEACHPVRSRKIS